MKKITYKDVMKQLGCKDKDEFYSLMKEHWGKGLDAILTFNPEIGKVEIFSIYSNDWFNYNTGRILLARLNLPDKNKFDNLWPDICYSIDMELKRAQKEVSNEQNKLNR